MFVRERATALRIGVSGLPLSGSELIQSVTSWTDWVSTSIESSGGIWIDGRLPRSRVERRVKRTEFEGDCGATMKLFVRPKLFAGTLRIRLADAVGVEMRASQLARWAGPPGW